MRDAAGHGLPVGSPQALGLIERARHEHRGYIGDPLATADAAPATARGVRAE